MHRGDNNEAEELFNQALSLKLPTETERAMVLMQLSQINAAKNKWNAAKKYFREAKQMKITDSTLKDQMNQFEKALNNRGQMRQVRAMGGKGRQMMNPGGKRRRPKMR